MTILSNQLRCGKCEDEPYSAHHHDFKYCKCGAVAVDGGMSYLRRVGDFKSATDMSISMKEDMVKQCRSNIEASRAAGGAGKEAFYATLAAIRGDRKFMHTFSEMSKEVKDICIKEVDDALDSGRNALGVVCAVTRTLRDNGYFNEMVNELGEVDGS